MSNQKKKGLVPKLRFPKFRSERWESTHFGKIYEFKSTNSLARNKLNYEHGSVKNIHYGDIHTKFPTLFDIEKEKVPYINPLVSLEKIKPESYCIERDMIFADASEDVDDVGKSIEIINLNGEKLLSGLHTLLARQIDNKLITGFGGYLFKSSGIRESIKREAQGAKVSGISGTRLSSIKIVYPQDKKEQQKIADCLSSIDENISTQTEKLNALKNHKKALMQQLFPGEGEITPKLRFPEFWDEEEWKSFYLGDVAEINNGESNSQDADTTGIYPLFDRSMSTKKSNRYLFDTEAIIVPGEGQTFIAKYYYGRFDLHQRCYAIHSFNKNIFPKFCYYYLMNSNNYFISVSVGSTVLSLRLGHFKQLPILLPLLSEQKAIADCLSSIDELITAQAEKIDMLKTHKKGLMQQLFPSCGEVDYAFS